MVAELIHDRGRGPEIVGTRITVYNLLPHFLDPEATEAYVCALYDLTAEQVAAARAYVLNHADTVLAEHLRIEARIATGNSPEIRERATQTREAFQRFKTWVDARRQDAAGSETTGAVVNGGSSRVPTFKEWCAQQQSRH